MRKPTISSRRQFLSQSLAGLGVAAGAGSLLAAAATATPKNYKIIAFSKPFRTLSASDTASLVAEVGWDGLELPVRNQSGQVSPAEVDQKLSEYHAALAAKGKEISLITTDITAADAAAQKVLKAAAKLGIKKYRLGSLRYQKGRSISEQVNNFRAQFRDLAALNKELGIQGAYQNHSGADYLGAPIWDIYSLVEDLDPASIGLCFDIGHATIEGGLSWPTEFRLVQSRLAAVFVKDFKWEKTASGGRIQWCPLGEGMVSKSFFAQLKATDFAGPICQHHEYNVGDRDTMIAHFKKDLALLREWLKAV